MPKADTNFDPNIPENWTIHDLQSATDEYNRLLSNDKIWKNFYNNIDFKSKSYSGTMAKLDLLNKICEFGENRLKEIKKEKEEDMELIKDLAINYLEDCESFNSEDFKVKSKSFNEIELELPFSTKCMKNRKTNDGFIIKENEILDYWENIIQLFKVLRSNGFESNISFYQTNGVEIRITIKRYEN
jgi:hypothetical protein